MRALLPLILTACGTATPREVPRLGPLLAPTCTITGELSASGVFALRFQGVPIAPLDHHHYLVELTADARRATARLATETRSHTYTGEVDLADVRVALARPLDHGWLGVTEVEIERISGGTAVVRPARDPLVHLSAPEAFTVACSDLRFADPPSSGAMIGVTPLVVTWPIELFDAPGGSRIATLKPYEGCKLETIEAYEMEVSGTFHRLRIPTLFGRLHAWVEAPTLRRDGYGVSFCGNTGGYPPLLIDDGRVCKRDVPILVEHRGRVVEVGTIRQGARIELSHRVGDRIELIAPVPGKLTPFVRVADIRSCRVDKIR